MRLVSRRAALLAVLALMLTLGQSGATAQEMDYPPFDLTTAEGFERAAIRNWIPDFEAIMASPTADGEVPVISGTVNAIAFVAEFDSDDNAEASIDTLDDQL